MLVLFLLPLLWAAPTETLRLESSVDAMGSTYSIAVYGEDRTRMEAAVEAAFEEVRRLDRMLSNYRPASELSAVNREAGSHPVKVTSEMFQLLAACMEYSKAGDGAFDITVGPLMKVWGFYKGTGHLPHRAEIRTALAKVGYRHMQLDAAAGTVEDDAAELAYQFTAGGLIVAAGHRGHRGHGVEHPLSAFCVDEAGCQQ